MRKIMNSLPILAFVLAIGSTLAFTDDDALVQQVSQKIAGICQGPVSMPNGCSFTAANICQAGVFYQYDSSTGLQCVTELRKP